MHFKSQVVIVSSNVKCADMFWGNAMSQSSRKVTFESSRDMTLSRLPCKILL